MTDMLPAEPSHALRLTEVLPTVADSLRGATSRLPEVRSAVVLVIDGLGAAALDARAGHARFLAGAKGRKDVAVSVFPTTTATALTSLMTGTAAGEHGIVGYRVRVPETGVLANQLTGWESDGLDPRGWQRSSTVFERLVDTPAFIVSKGVYRDSGFTRAAFGAADFIAADDLEERLLRAAETAADNPGSLVYTYAPELDQLGHRAGWESDEWTAELERVDAAVGAFAEALRPGTGAVVTSDHGMVDVPRRAHVLLQEGDPLTAGVAAVGGEPRMLHLYAEPGRAAEMHHAWLTAEASRSWVFTRDEAIGAGLFGRTVAPDVAARIGEVLVAPRARVAYYDDRLTDKAAQRMIGQHGSLTSAERIVPLIRLGAYAR